MSARKAGEVDAAHEARLVLRAARARAHRPTDRFVDAYVAAFALLLLSVWFLSFVREASVATEWVGDSMVEATSVLLAGSWALTLGGLLTLVLGAIGPISSSRAEARWLLSTTADRAILLGRSFKAMVSGSVLAGAVVGLVVAIAACGGALAALPLLAGAGVGALVGVAAALGLLAAQARQGRRASCSPQPVGRLSGGTAVVVGLTLLMAAETLEDGIVTVGLPRYAWLLLALMAIVTVGAVVALGVRASRLLADLDDAGLTAGREVLDAVTGSVVSMDAQLAEGLTRRRRTARRGRFTSRRGRGRGALALLDADMAMVRRRWRGLLLHLAWIPLAVGVARGSSDEVALVGMGLAATGAARSGGIGLRTWLGSPGLRRAVTTPRAAVVAALSVAPVLVGTSISLPVVLILETPVWAAVHLALAGLAATIRSETPAGRELGPLVATPMGALPLGLVRAVLRGPDLAFGLSVLLVAWAQPWVLLPAGGAVVWQISRSRL